MELYLVVLQAATGSVRKLNGILVGSVESAEFPESRLHAFISDRSAFRLSRSREIMMI